MSKLLDRSKFRNALRLGVESLEDRRLLAGNISATFYGGNLVLRGDAADNAIIVSQPAPNQVTLVGKTNSSSTTTINGSAGPVVFTGILLSIDADLKAGNDQFLVGNNTTEVNALNNEILFGAAGTFSGLATARTVVKYGINFRGGDGTDSAAIFADVGASIYADMGANNDGIAVQGSVVKGSVILIGGTENQQSHLVRNSAVGNQITIYGGTGSSRVILDASSALGVTILTQNSNDQIIVSSSNIKHSLVISTLGGGDEITTTGSIIGGSWIVNSGADDDLVTLNSTTIRFDAIVHTGSGNDAVDVVSKGSTQTTIGSDGNDQLTIRNAQFGSGVTVSMGLGNDHATISNVTIRRNLSVFLGLGNDDLLVDSTSAAFADLYGGPGNDGRRLMGNTFGRATVLEFERTSAAPA